LRETFSGLWSRLRLRNKLRKPERLEVVYDNPSEMSIPERLFLYALVRGSRPERALEIGSYKGGSAAIICAAMQDNQHGRLIGVDPKPRITVPEGAFHGRFRLIPRPSPEAIGLAWAVAGGPFDFVLIDGLHIYDQVKEDIAGCLPHLADGAYLLFHDAFHHGVSEAIREAVQELASLHDCGYVCATPDTSQDALVAYGGFRLLRYAVSLLADPQRHLESACLSQGRAVPPAHPDLRNHNHWYCRKVQPCPHCQSQDI
jgi:predicted O-methyltransferase YrrM